MADPGVRAPSSPHRRDCSLGARGALWGAAVTGGLKHRALLQSAAPTPTPSPFRDRQAGPKCPGSANRVQVTPARSVQEARGRPRVPVAAMPRLAVPAYQLKRFKMTSGTVGESSKWNFGVGLGSLPSASQVLMSSKSTAARSIPLIPMATELRARRRERRQFAAGERDGVEAVRGERELGGR